MVGRENDKDVDMKVNTQPRGIDATNMDTKEANQILSKRDVEAHSRTRIKGNRFYDARQ